MNEPQTDRRKAIMSDDDKRVFAHELAAIINDSNNARLTDDERTWVRLAIKKEAQSIKLREAIIEKTLAGLAWALILGIGVVGMEFLRNHGFKP